MRGVGAIIGGELALSQPLVDLGALGEDLGGLWLPLDGDVQCVERLALTSKGGEREAHHEIAAKIGRDTQAQDLAQFQRVEGTPLAQVDLRLEQQSCAVIGIRAEDAINRRIGLSDVTSM